MSDDGLQEVSSKRVDSAWVNPDADFSEFRRFAIAEIDVAFRRNWLRDQNKDRRSLSQRVSQADADRIRTTIAEEFRIILTEELEKSGYPVVDISAENSARDILVLRPDILDLDVAAPDTGSSGMSRSYTTSAGSMTLSLEFHDALTGTLLGRITDRQTAPDLGFMRISNSVTNRSEADRMMRRWARMLVEKLDAVR